MKKKILLSALSVCVLLALSLVFLPAAAGIGEPESKKFEDKVLSARFTNMLNRNYSYDYDFENADILVDNATLALLDNRDKENPDYISDALIKGFVDDMYGIEVTEIADESDMHKEGLVYIVPRGYTEYHHKICKIVPNEDGSFTVNSKVVVSPHDGDEFETTAETLFVPNSKSAFGYNIIYSNLTGLKSGI